MARDRRPRRLPRPEARSAVPAWRGARKRGKSCLGGGPGGGWGPAGRSGERTGSLSSRGNPGFWLRPRAWGRGGCPWLAGGGECAAAGEIGNSSVQNKRRLRPVPREVR